MNNFLEFINKDIETKRILKQLSRTSRALAELKGVAKTMPNQNILINAIMINEAKTSSNIENIVTDIKCFFENRRYIFWTVRKIPTDSFK